MEMEKDPNIVVIGAGIAGISAAKILFEHGMKNVTILEATNRIGGRIHTTDFDETRKLELGAQFIHGNGVNPIYKLALEHDLLGDESWYAHEDSETEDGNFYTPDGKLVPVHVVKEVCAVIDGIFEDANKFYREGHPLEDVTESIGTFTHRQFYKYLRTTCAAESEALIRMREGVFNWKFLSQKTENACNSLYETSIIAWGEYVECLDSNNDYSEMINFNPEHGFGSLLKILLKSVPSSSIKLSTPVQRIAWDQSTFHGNKAGEKSNEETASSEAGIPSPPAVDIHTADGQVISADHVIVTCSLGFLKRNAHYMFKPLLPNDKLAAIHRMGFGTVNKIFLEFEQPWWDKDTSGMQFAWTAGEQFVLNCVDNSRSAEYLRKDWFKGIQGFDPLEGFPNWLLGWIAGEESETMETIPEDVVLNVCHELLQRFCARADIVKPTRIIRSAWNSERFTAGSYSYHRVGNSAAECDILAKPVCANSVPRILFAGEATHRQYYSTTHGALLSGEREAKRLIQLYSS